MIILFEDRKSGPIEMDKRQSRLQKPLFGRVSWRKARAIADISDGLLTPEAACERYGFSADELAPWQRALQSFGLKKPRKADPD
jgi:hypothetical protein